MSPETFNRQRRRIYLLRPLLFILVLVFVFSLSAPLSIDAQIDAVKQRLAGKHAAPETPSVINVPNGMAVVTGNGSDGLTLRVMDITQFGPLWSNPANLAPNYVSTPAQMPTMQSWVPTDFNFTSASQPVRGLAISSDGTRIYVGASGYTGGDKSANVYKIGPSTSTPAILYSLPNYTATLTDRKGIAALDLDETHNQIFASNFADGIIYRNDAATGAFKSQFDPLTPFAGGTTLPPYGERITAVAYNKIENRLYYGTWGYNIIAATGTNTIRSIGLDALGDFISATDQLEFTLSSSRAPAMDIEFNNVGNRMLIAEETLLEQAPNVINQGAHQARGLEYTGAAGAWTIDPTNYSGSGRKYSIGNFTSLTNGRGGVAWGYTSINIFTGAITGDESFVVFTGDALRLDVPASIYVYGLQYTPSSGGAAGGGAVFSNSLITDLDYDVTVQDDKFSYGDVDIRRVLTPTAAEVSLSGAVLSAAGSGVSRASVTLTGMNGIARSSITNAFGYYRFENVRAGQSYILTVNAKGRNFSPQLITVNGEMTDVNLIQEQ